MVSAGHVGGTRVQVLCLAQLTGSGDLGLHVVEPSGNKRACKSRSPLS